MPFQWYESYRWLNRKRYGKGRHIFLSVLPPVASLTLSPLSPYCHRRFGFSETARCISTWWLFRNEVCSAFCSMASCNLRRPVGYSICRYLPAPCSTPSGTALHLWSERSSHGIPCWRWEESRFPYKSSPPAGVSHAPWCRSCWLPYVKCSLHATSERSAFSSMYSLQYAQRASCGTLWFPCSAPLGHTWCWLNGKSLSPAPPVTRRSEVLWLPFRWLSTRHAWCSRR